MPAMGAVGTPAQKLLAGVKAIDNDIEKAANEKAENTYKKNERNIHGVKIKTEKLQRKI